MTSMLARIPPTLAALHHQMLIAAPDDIAIELRPLQVIACQHPWEPTVTTPNPRICGPETSPPA